MSKQLPVKPNLDHLREQAKSLLSDYRRAAPEALERVRENLPGFDGGAIALHDAQSVIAREYGFLSWPKLVASVEEIRAREGITPEIEEEYVEAAVSDHPQRIKRLLELYPGLARFSPACALVSAEVDLVAEVNATEKLGPMSLTPIEYVAYSRVQQVFPERASAQAEAARILLERGADPNTFHIYRGTDFKLPVLYGAAAESGHPEIVRELLKHGANPNDGESIYHSAEHGRLDILEILQEHGAKFGPPSEDLGFLVWFRWFDASAPRMLAGAKWLLEHGSTPNIVRGEEKQTPLHSACRYGSLELLGLLLDHDADPTIRDAEGSTPYQVAFACGNEEAMRFLESRGIRDEPSLDDAFFAACARNDTAIVHQEPELLARLQKRGAELMEQFATMGQADGLRGFLRAGFPPGKSSFATPLHFACIQGRVEAARVLVEAGADLNLHDDAHHAPPIGWACYGSVNHRSPGSDHVGVIRLLMRAGCSLEDALLQLTYDAHPQDVMDAIREEAAKR